MVQRESQLASRLSWFVAVFLTLFALFALVVWRTLDAVRVKGPLYEEIITGNVLIADDMALSDEDAAKLDAPAPNSAAPAKAGDDGALWTPQDQEEAGQWQSQVRLSMNFFRECITNPVPIDLRAYKSLRGNPLAMDVYTWLTYRMSYTTRRSRPIPWEALMMQFGSGYGSGNTADPQQGVRDFKKAFLRALKLVGIVYPDARVDPTDAGLVLAPSKTHIPRSPGGQGQLF